MEKLTVYIGVLLGTLIGFFLYSFFADSSLSWGVVIAILLGELIVFCLLIFITSALKSGKTSK